MKSESVRIPSPSGHELDARLDLPDDDAPKGYALFAHCFTCGKSLNVIQRVSQELTAAGIGLLRFDFTGLGESEGEFSETTFTTNLEDLRAAAEHLATERTAPGVLIGHSLGGAAILAVAPELAGGKCVATIGAPADPVHVRRLFNEAEFDENDTAEVSIGGRPFAIGRQFVDDLERHDLEERLASLDKPLLVFHSPVDSIVGIDNAERIFKAANHPRSFVSLGEADHLVSDKRDAAFLGRVLAAWASRYID